MKFFPRPGSVLKTVGCSVFAALAIGLASSVQGQVSTSYTTNFDNLTDNSTLSGQDGWNDTDPNAPDGVAYLGGYSTGAGDYKALFGGAYISQGFGPTTSPANLYHSFVPVSGTNIVFNTDFAISASTAGYDSSNQFGFAFGSVVPGINPLPATITNQFSVDFVPTATSDASVYAIRYSVGGTQASTGLGLNVNQLLHLSLFVNAATDTLSFTVTPENASLVATGVPLVVNGIQLTAAQVAAVTDVSATYALGSATTPGSNTLIFDNFSVIPEPSTLAMLGLGVVGLAARFRCKAKA